MKNTLLVLCVVCTLTSAHSQEPEKQLPTDTIKQYTTAWVKGEAPHIDGKINEAAWGQINWAGGDFRQLNPDKGKPATVQTKFKILYDAKNLYVAIRCLDPEPDKIVKRMSRRDSFEGDMVEINLDSYNDKRTAFSFTASVSGVKGDEYVSNNGDSWDAGWDPIWYLATSVDSEGWVAEFRIPLSQLRFAKKDELTWGLQITRIFFRNQERSIWQYIPPDAGGWVHLFGQMNGIKGVKPQKQLEVQPFVVGQTEKFQEEEGNPFQTGSRTGVNAGLDAKIGLTSDITLDLTVNPDFGQVEADPSQVNLSAFELYFQERRPFFIEGNNTLNFPVSMINQNNLFYSRRIGRQPQGGVVTDDDDRNNDGEINDDDDNDDVSEYVKPNRYTSILGAAKLTGKNKHGFSWGILETLTQKEYAEVDSLGYRREEAIEPQTNYFVARAQQDINKGNTVVGGMFTSVNRKIDEMELNWLHNDAYSGGIDLLHHWKKRTYYISGRTSFSHVRGSTEAISNTQKSSERFFQRPDNYHTEYDPTRTSLTGSGGQLVVGKKSGDIVADLGVVWQSPEFEINDIGFLSQTDNISQWFWMQYRVLEPKGVTRWQRFNINQWRDYDFGKKLIGSGYNVNAHTQFKNFYSIGGGVTYQEMVVSNADLRGGPSIRYPGGAWFWAFVGSDNRKKLFAELNTEFFRGSEKYSHQEFYNVNLTYRPINALNISVSAAFSRNVNEMQYVNTPSDTLGSDYYIIGKIDQSVARISLRLTYMLTPNLSIQYWGQPFGTSGKYSTFKNVTDARASEYNRRFTHLQSGLSLTDDSYYFNSPEKDRDYSFKNPAFNIGQFRSNMVVRWEYIPGSTVFLVWTQEMNGEYYDNTPGYKRYSFHFPDKAHNIFLIKYTYRFVL